MEIKECPACSGTKVDLVNCGDCEEREPCPLCGGTGEVEKDYDIGNYKAEAADNARRITARIRGR